jgi:hypothetical protein
MSTLDTFFNRILASNPFTDNRVNGPSDHEVDVDAIHHQAFDQLTALAREACAEHRGIGAMLWGEAGIGKSHLLARLSRWAGADRHALLVYLHNLQAGPDNLPRSLLKSVLSILTRGRVHAFHTTELFWLVNAALREALRDNPKPLYSRHEAEAAYRRLIDRVSGADPSRAALVDRTAYDVLLSFFCSASMARRGEGDGRQAGVAVRWLAGDALDPAEAAELGVAPARRPDLPVALEDNQQIKHVLVALSQLALLRGQPFILCFDQVDNLDPEQAAALARFLEALIDSAPNLLVVVAGVQATLFQWRQQKVIQDSAWDRLAQFEIGLHRVPATEARALVAARLHRFLEPFHAVPDLRRPDDLFPLGKRWEAEFLAGKIEVRPRDVVNWAREGWRREQEALRQLGGPAWLAGWVGRQPPPPAPAPTSESLDEAIDRKIDERISELVARREREPFSLPPDAYHLAALVAALLEQALPGVEVEEPAPARGSPRPAYDLVVRHPDGGPGQPARTGVLCVATESATSAAAALRRLVQDRHPPDRVLVVTDARLPLPLATRGKHYHERLRRRGAAAYRHIKLTLRQYAELDALQAVVGAARSGDLEVELPGGRSAPVREPDVIASHLRRRRYDSAAVLRDLLGDLASRAVGPAAV